MPYPAKRDPEYLPDRLGVYLEGVYTFEELIDIATEARLRADGEGERRRPITKDREYRGYRRPRGLPI